MLGGSIASAFQRCGEDSDMEEDEFVEEKAQRLCALSRRASAQVSADETARRPAVDEFGRELRTTVPAAKSASPPRRHPSSRAMERPRWHGARLDSSSPVAKRPREDEDDYVERSRAWRREQRERVPVLGGPRQDENPIIDYILKSRLQRATGGQPGAQRGSGGRAGGASVNTDVVASAIRGAQRHNMIEDTRQIDGAQAKLDAHGHAGDAVVLMSSQLNRPPMKGAASVDAGDVPPASAEAWREESRRT
jgi:hypothetical protein